MPTQHTTSTIPSLPAITYAGAGQDMDHRQRRPGRLGECPAAVYSSFNGSKLVNKGEVFSNTGFGVYFQAAKNGTVINKANGSIVGGYGVVLGTSPAPRT